MNKIVISRVILFVLSSVSLLSFSTELDVNQSLRARIKSQLAAAPTCPQVVSSTVRSGTLSRGVTRSLNRGIEPVQKSGIPEKAVEFSQLFGKTIQVEFNLPYGFDSDPNAFYFLKTDPYEGPAKLEIYSSLGYVWGRGDSPTSAPDWFKFAQNFRSQLASLGIHVDEFFVPALVLFKKVGQKVNSQGILVDTFDYLILDPLSEPFPQDMSEWTVLTKDIQFNIPFDVIIKAMKAGKFPLMDANHDVSHFISFLRFPKLTKAIRAQLSRLGESDFTRGFKLRQYWLTAALSVLDPEAQHIEFLEMRKRPTNQRTSIEIENELQTWTEKRLVRYAIELARYFESQLRDVSGGNSNPAEKWYYLSESFGMSALDMINEDISRSNQLFRVRELADTYFNQGPVTLNANPKKMTNETATFNFNTFVASQKILALLLADSKSGSLDRLGNWNRQEALKSLRKFVAKTEFMLVSRPITYQEWAEMFLSPNMSASSPLAQFLMEVFGNPIISKHYLGEGAKRSD